MTTNPFDQNALMRELKAIRDMLRANPLRHASVDRGRLRMKNGSELLIEGLLTVIGRLILEGDMQVTGGGSITVGGVVITPLGGGRIQIGPNIVLDSSTQKITIGTGSSQIVIDGATGTMTLNGEHPIVLRNDAGEAVVDLGVGELRSNGTQAGINAGAFWAGVAAAGAILGTADGSRQFAATADGLFARGVGAIGSGSGTVDAIGVDQNGKIVRLSTAV